MKIKFLIFSILLANSNVIAKILIIVTPYNRPDFIEWQHKTFKAFSQDDYEYVICNDASDENKEKNDILMNFIEDICHKSTLLKV